MSSMFYVSHMILYTVHENGVNMPELLPFVDIS